MNIWGEMYEMNAVESINPGAYQSPQPATEWQQQSGLKQNANVNDNCFYGRKFSKKS